MGRLFHKTCRVLLLALFLLNNVIPPNYARAQVAIPQLPVVPLSQHYSPAIVRGLSVYPEDPLKFDFIVDSGDDNLTGTAFKAESEKLIKYFLAALTVPEKELWVNLSPYEKDRVIPEGLGATQMGIDMLGQDYLLKQVTASLIHPESDLGREFWARVYEKAFAKFGTTDIPLDTFHKVWIAPDRAVVYETGNRVFVAGRHLKVQLEKDYLAAAKAVGKDAVAEGSSGDEIQPALIKEIIIPAIEKEVNAGRNFAALRQIYNSMILAAWYKKKLHATILGQGYANANTTQGIRTGDLAAKEKLYQQYLETFKKGVFNLIKEEYDPASRQVIPRKYFSGGLSVGAASVEDLDVLTGDASQLPAGTRDFIVHPESDKGQDQKVTWQAVEGQGAADAAQPTILDAHELLPFQPINPVADFEAREFPDIRVAARKGGLPLFIDISDDLKTLTYYEVLDDSHVFSPDGTVHQDILSEANGTLRKVAEFPSSYLVSPRKWMLDHYKGTPEGGVIERIWPQGKRYSRYRGVTTSWDMEVDKDVWSTNIDTVFLHKTLLEEGVLSLSAQKVRKVAEIGVGGGHISSLLAKTFPQARLSITDISSYALSTTLLNIAANVPGGLAALDRVRKFWGKGIKALEPDQDLIVINPPYIPAAPFEKGPANDPYRGTGLIREMLKHGIAKLNQGNPEASIYINISSLADKDVRGYLNEFGDKIEFVPVGPSLKVPLKIRWMSEAWKQWLLYENGGLEQIEHPAADQEEYWHTLQMYRIRRKPEIASPKRVAIIGGTFDPLHIAHRKMIEDVKAELHVDEVVVVPANVSPHKLGQFMAPKEVRLDMVKAALKGMPGVKVSDFNVRQDGPSYTIDLVNHLEGQYPPNSKFFFVMGDDNVAKLDTWKDIDQLVKKVNFVTYTRPGHHAVNPRIKVARIERPGIDISATVIRRRVALGMPLTGFVAPEVEKIIDANGLYLPEDVFGADDHDPIVSLNGEPFKDDKPFTVLADAHGVLLKPTWKNELAQVFTSLSGGSMKEGLKWAEDNVIARMVETTRDIPVDEIVTMLVRELSLRNIQMTRPEVIAAMSKARGHFESVERAEPMPGALEALRALKEMGIPVRVITGRASELVYEQLKHAGFADLIQPEDVFGKDRQDALPVTAEDRGYSPRERMIKVLSTSHSERRAIVLDDWVESARATREMDGIFVGLPQGTDREQKRNFNRLAAAGAALEITNAIGWERLVSLVKVLNARREDRLRSMETKNVRVAMAQFNPTVGDLTGNFNEISQRIAAAKDKHVDVIVFPELAVTGYFPGDLLRKPGFVDQNREMVQLLAASTRGITAVVGFVDINKQGQIYNALAVLADGAIKGVYRKRALPNYGVFFEKRYFTPGESGLFDFEGNPLNKDVFSVDGLMFAVNDCEDIWVEKDGVKKDYDGHSIQEPVDHHVVAPYMEQASKGAHLIINASASPFRDGVLKTREDLIAARAKQTGATIVYVNTVGGQDDVVFDGNSMVVGPDGKTIARGRSFEEDMVIMDLPVKTEKHTGKELSGTITVKKSVPDVEKVDLPSVPEIGPQVDIEVIFKSLILSLRDYARKNRFKKVIFGNSGGIDSGVVGALAAIAVGPENVHSMSLPTRYNSSETKSDARRLAEKLKIGFEEISIEPVFQKMIGALLPVPGSPLSEATKTAIENIQARIRMVFLMFRSNQLGYLLVSTSNKSETAVGFTTIGGDMSGGFALVKDVYKTRIFELARYINQYLGQEVIPESMINRPPSAELRDNQEDSQSLPDYTTELDPILKALVEEHLSPEEVSKKTGLVSGMVRAVAKMLGMAEWKRRQGPIGPKLTPVSFNHYERRMPITNLYDPDKVASFIRSARQALPDQGTRVDPEQNRIWLEEVLADTTVPFWELSAEERVAYLNRFSWSHKYPKRNLKDPVVYTDPNVIKSARTEQNPKGWAQPDLDDGTLTAAQRQARLVRIKDDTMTWAPDTLFVDGRPRNDQETGLNGRGKLGSYGPNQAEDPILLRYGPSGELEVLVIERSDGTGWGFPGGFANRGQENDAGLTATREAIEETLKESEFAVDFSKGKLLFDGKAYSSRDTNDAWVKTRALAVLLSYEQSRKLKIVGDDDAKGGAWWLRVDKELLTKMVDAHPVILKRAVAAVVSGELAVNDDLVLPKDQLMADHSMKKEEDHPADHGRTIDDIIAAIFGKLDRTYSAPEQEHSFYRRIQLSWDKLDALLKGEPGSFQDPKAFARLARQPLSVASLEKLSVLTRDMEKKYPGMLRPTLALLDVGKIEAFRAKPEFQPLNFANHPHAGAYILEHLGVFKSMGFSEEQQALALAQVREHGFLGQSKRGEVTNEVFRGILDEAIQRKDPDILKLYFVLNVIDTAVVREGLFTEEFFTWFYHKYEELHALATRAVTSGQNAEQVLSVRAEEMLATGELKESYVLDRLSAIWTDKDRGDIHAAIARVFARNETAKARFIDLLARQKGSLSFWYPEIAFTAIDALESRITLLSLVMEKAVTSNMGAGHPLDVSFFPLANEMNRRDEPQLQAENRSFLVAGLGALTEKYMAGGTTELSSVAGVTCRVDDTHHAVYVDFDPLAPLHQDRDQIEKRVKEIDAIVASVDSGDPMAFVKRAGVPGAGKVSVLMASVDPLQNAHLKIIENAVSREDVDELVIVLSKDHILKENFSGSLASRIFMLEHMVKSLEHGDKITIAVANTGRFLELPGLLKPSYPDAHFDYFMGFDNFEQMLDEKASVNDRKMMEAFLSGNSVTVVPRWYYKKDDIRRVMVEHGFAEHLSSVRAAVPLNREFRFHSGTEVQRRLREGLGAGDMVPMSVLRIIKAMGWYTRTAEPDLQAVRNPVKVSFVNLTSPRHKVLVEPLGIGALMGDLRREFGQDVSLSHIDTQVGLSVQDIVAQLRKTKPQIIALSAQLESHEVLSELLGSLQQEPWVQDGRSRVLVGGNLPTNEHRLFLEKYPFIVVVRGEGEIAMREAVRLVRGDIAIDEMPAAAFIRNKKIVENDGTPVSAEALGQPSRDSLLWILDHEGDVQIETSRGCGFGLCSFCFKDPFRAHKWEPFPDEVVLDNLESLYRSGARHVNLADSEFFGGGKETMRGIRRGRRLAEEILRREIKLSIAFSARVDSVFGESDSPEDRQEKIETLKIMRKAGFENVFLGVESGSPSQLKRYHKGATIVEAEQAVRILRELGYTFMVGMIPLDPYVSLEEIVENGKFMRRNNLFLEVSFPVNPLRVQPKTEYYKWTLRDKLLGEQTGRFYDFESRYQDPKVQKVADALKQYTAEIGSVFYMIKYMYRTMDLMHLPDEEKERELLKSIFIRYNRLEVDFMEALAQAALADSTGDFDQAIQRSRYARAMLVREVKTEIEHGIISDKEGFLAREVGTLDKMMHEVLGAHAGDEVKDHTKPGPDASADIKKGGIDLDPAMMDLQVRKDARGIALPLGMPSAAGTKIESITPVIISVSPVNVEDLLAP